MSNAVSKINLSSVSKMMIGKDEAKNNVHFGFKRLFEHVYNADEEEKNINFSLELPLAKSPNEDD